MTDDVSFGFQQEQGVLRVNIPYDPRKSQPPTPVQPPPPAPSPCALVLPLCLAPLWHPQRPKKKEKK